MGEAPKGWRAPLSPTNCGRLIMLIGIVMASPDSLIVRFLLEVGTHPLCVITWKMAFISCLCGAYVVAKSGGPRRLWSRVVAGRLHIPIAGVLQASVDMGLTLSLVYTSAANALLFISLNPLWAALLGFSVLKESLPRHTIVALASSLCAVLVIFVPATVHTDAAEGHVWGSMPLVGNSVAILTGLLLACMITTLRHAGKHAPDAEMTVCTALGAGLAAVLGASVASAAGLGALPSTAGFDPGRPQWHFWGAVAADAVCLSTFCVCVAVAPAYISGAEVGLVMLLEVVLGPLWVWTAYGDVPSRSTLLGGALLLASLAAHETYSLVKGEHGDETAALEPARGKDGSSPTMNNAAAAGEFNERVASEVVSDGEEASVYA